MGLNVPDTVNVVPSTSAPRKVTKVWNSADSGEVYNPTSTPRCSATSGAFTYVTESATFANRPLEAASGNTETSLRTTSPRTSTVTDWTALSASAVKVLPRRSAKGSSGRTSSATTPPAWTFAASGTNSPDSA